MYFVNDIGIVIANHCTTAPIREFTELTTPSGTGLLSKTVVTYPFRCGVRWHYQNKKTIACARSIALLKMVLAGL